MLINCLFVAVYTNVHVTPVVRMSNKDILKVGTTSALSNIRCLNDVSSNLDFEITYTGESNSDVKKRKPHPPEVLETTPCMYVP